MVHQMCLLLFRFCSVELPSGAETIFGSKQCKITLMMFHYVPCSQLLRFVCETAPQQGCKVSLAPPDGSYHVGDLEALCRGSVPFPDSGVHVHIRPADAVVRSASGEDPQLVNIDCTGLGDHDLGGFKDYDICLRTDKHSQSIYGPSVTPLECPAGMGHIR